MIGAALLFGVVTAEAAQPPSRSTAWVPDGEVLALVADGKHVYLGGEFSRVGSPTGPFVVVRRGRSSPDLAVAQLRDGDSISSVTDDGRGGWVVAGGFRSVDGRACPDLAHG